MNVLFIDPPSIEGGVREKKNGAKAVSPNMGILYMSTYLRSKTNSIIQVIDMAAQEISFKDTGKIVKSFKPSLVGISSKTFNILSAYKLADIIKKVAKKTIVVVGGAHPTALPVYTLQECENIDAIIVREGESTIIDLHMRMHEGYELQDEIFDNLAGVVWRNSLGEIIENQERKLIQDLDSLPFPDFSFVNYSKYKRVYNPNKHKFQHVFPIFGSRGCPFNCTFCMPLHSRRHRVRSIECILEEIELLHQEYAAERIYFEDSLFCSSKAWFEEFCEQYKMKGLHRKLQWGFETRIDTANSDMFKAAKEAGCIYTFFGVESGSEEVLKKANKGYSKESIIQRVTEAKQAGIDAVNVSLIMGLPYETKKTIESTLKLIEELPCDGVGINILDIYPGTTAFNMADSGEGGLRWIQGNRMNWKAYSRDEPMAEVNDLSSSDIVIAAKKGLRMSVKKSRGNRAKIWKKRLAYSLELARVDRPRLCRYFFETLKGER
jgi:radical SAM superfamily enzyme YgiQ (UPF0313 family)